MMNQQSGMRKAEVYSEVFTGKYVYLHLLHIEDWNMFLSFRMRTFLESKIFLAGLYFKDWWTVKIWF